MLIGALMRAIMRLHNIFKRNKENKNEFDRLNDTCNSAFNSAFNKCRLDFGRELVEIMGMYLLIMLIPSALLMHTGLEEQEDISESMIPGQRICNSSRLGHGDVEKYTDEPLTKVLAGVLDVPSAWALEEVREAERVSYYKIYCKNITIALLLQ